MTEAGEARSLVLVVDDDAHTRHMVALLLDTTQRYVVETAADGLQALERLADRSRPQPDLVILDVMMPGIDGYALLSWIRNHEWLFDLPVVLLTARTSADDEAAGWYQGCDAYVPKPFDADDLERIVRDVLLASPELRIARRRRRLNDQLRLGAGETPAHIRNTP